MIDKILAEIATDKWFILGLTGQILFGSRFLVQWLRSEAKKESHIPLVFWYLSIGGGIILFIYAILRKEAVFALGQSCGLIVYIRNLCLIYGLAIHEIK